MNLNHLHCIDLDQPSLEGFRKFISAWLYKDQQLAFVVDPGPLSTIHHLLGELRRHGVERLDFILLTHIHIDHAGGTGALLKEFPEARVICHPEGAPHMMDPELLWRGSRLTLGQMAEVYGDILPVPAASIAFEEQIGGCGPKVFLTPGHAHHHVCYLLDDLLGGLLFGGEVAGVHYPVAEGIYMRPATPSRFILEDALDSLDRMIALAPRCLALGHHGLVEPALDYLQIGRRQLLLWIRGVAETCRAAKDQREEAVFSWLLDNDENFCNIRKLPADIYARELFFLGNSLRGMMEYVDSLSEAKVQELLAMGS